MSSQEEGGRGGGLVWEIEPEGQEGEGGSQEVKRDTRRETWVDG